MAIKLFDRINELKMLYLFVSRNSEAVLCRQFQQQASEVLGLQTLAIKTATIQKQLVKYEVSLKALSLNDV